jgi:hypothetical protein
VIWPAEVEVPPRPVQGLRVPPPGEQEGELCLRADPGFPTCLGKLELRRNPDLGGCYCFKIAPCSSCMSEVPECPKCGWRSEEPS